VKYLFDTDIISTLMKGRASSQLMERLEAAAGDSQAISAVTVFEVYYGAHRSADPKRFIKLFETEVLSIVEIVPFDDNAAQEKYEPSANESENPSPPAIYKSRQRHWHRDGSS
jgi:predicted nucleic acid-binding protein